MCEFSSGVFRDARGSGGLPSFFDVALKRCQKVPAVLPSRRDIPCCGYLEVRCTAVGEYFFKRQQALRKGFVCMGNPMISFVIPVYNGKEYLRNCLDSILAMGLDLFEIVLIDDGSTDGSTEISCAYAEKYPFIRLELQENTGPSAARNRGLDLSCGEYIAFFDADDYISPAALRKTIAQLREYPEAELWVSDFCRVADNGCVLDQVYQIDDTTEPIWAEGYLRQFLRRQDCVWNVWRYLFKREFLVRNRLRFIEGVDCAEDLEFVVRALTKAEKLAFFHNPYYFYRVNYGETLTRRYSAERSGHLTEMLRSSAAYLSGQSTDKAQPFLNKIGLEFILNLSLIWEVPPNERLQTRQSFQEAAWITGLTDRSVLRLLGIAASHGSIDAVSWAFYHLKCVKRRLRKAKAARYRGGRMEA